MTLIIEYLGGNCPVQAEGTIDGKPFYFRSRGEAWSMGIGGDAVGDPEWQHVERYGPWPDAGWITEDEARTFIDKAVKLYRERSIRDGTARERLQREKWDAWYSSLPNDLRRKLSLHDFKRLGDCFKDAFQIP